MARGIGGLYWSGLLRLEGAGLLRMLMHLSGRMVLDRPGVLVGHQARVRLERLRRDHSVLAREHVNRLHHADGLAQGEGLNVVAGGNTESFWRDGAVVFNSGSEVECGGVASGGGQVEGSS